MLKYRSWAEMPCGASETRYQTGNTAQRHQTAGGQHGLAIYQRGGTAVQSTRWPGHHTDILTETPPVAAALLLLPPVSALTWVSCSRMSRSASVCGGRTRKQLSSTWIRQWTERTTAGSPAAGAGTGHTPADGSYSSSELPHTAAHRVRLQQRAATHRNTLSQTPAASCHTPQHTESDAGSELPHTAAHRVRLRS